MGDVGAPELLIILAVVLLLFGGAKLPELAKSLGKAKKEFQKGVEEGMPDVDHGHLPATVTQHEAIPPATPVTPVTHVVSQDQPDARN